MKEYGLTFTVISGNPQYQPVNVVVVIPEELALKLMGMPMEKGHVTMSMRTNRGLLDDKTPLLDYKYL